MTPRCEPGKHRTLVQINTGVKPSGKAVPYICLSCGSAFAGVQFDVNDKDIDAVLQLAAEQTRDNLKTLRVTPTK